MAFLRMHNKSPMQQEKEMGQDTTIRNWSLQELQAANSKRKHPNGLYWLSRRCRYSHSFRPSRTRCEGDTSGISVSLRQRLPTLTSTPFPLCICAQVSTSQRVWSHARMHARLNRLRFRTTRIAETNSGGRPPLSHWRACKWRTGPAA